MITGMVSYVAHAIRIDRPQDRLHTRRLPSLFTAQSTDRTWDRWLATQPGAHVLQLSGWRRLKERFGWRGASLVGTSPGSELVSGCQLLFKRTAGLTLAYAPRGPVTAWTNRFETELLLQAIHHDARKRGAAVLKIEPDLPDSPAIAPCCNRTDLSRAARRCSRPARSYLT